jgi:lipoprotein-anchoring transpeptidase ErfK/SrfK
MKKILAVVFILLFILPACGHKNNSKDYLSEQPVIEQADKESIDETNQNTDNQAQDSFDLEKTAGMTDDETPLPEDIEQLDDDASLEPDETEKKDDKEKIKENQKKPMPYKIQIDVTNQVVTVFGRDKNGNYTKVVRQMICSTGTDVTPTPLGTFIMPGHKGRWGYFAKFGVYAQYWSRIKGGILFHSVIFAKPDESTLSVSSFLNLGRKASHGCVRLLVEDAKWIYDNISAGTEVTVVKGKKNPALTASLKPRLKPVKVEIQTPGPVDMLVGETKNINVRVTYQYGVVEQNPSDISWSVSDKQVVSVKDGTIQALAPGKTAVTAAIGQLSSNPITINVKKATPEEPQDPQDPAPEEPQDPKEPPPEEPKDPQDPAPEEPKDPQNPTPEEPKDPKEPPPEEPKDPQDPAPEEPKDPADGSQPGEP